MFDENGFRDHGAQPAWLNETQHRGHDMDKEENQITHDQILAALKTLGFQQHLEFARDRLII